MSAIWNSLGLRCLQSSPGTVRQEKYKNLPRITPLKMFRKFEGFKNILLKKEHEEDHKLEMASKK